MVEVLVAVTITALLLTTIYGVFTSVSTAKERVEGSGEGYHQARILFDRIGRELRGAYFLPTKNKTRFAGGLTGEQYPYLELSTTATTPQGGNRGGIAIVRYELQPDPEAPTGGPPDEVPQVLLRWEYNLSDPEEEERPGYRLATGIFDFKLRFHNGSEWLEEWQARPGGLPKMVELTMSIPIDGEPVPFRTAFGMEGIQ
ncbi:MAG: hypothetical protein IH614_15915 [Desulfuromonadales bacterium]|nr:hypothetical protein [Desulfuromonadales bacterium]